MARLNRQWFFSTSTHCELGNTRVILHDHERVSRKDLPGGHHNQGRGNNGIGLMGARYEIQVLDSYNNKTYPEGQCAAVYNQRPPMVNVSRKPGEWQTFDILFTARASVRTANFGSRLK